MARLRIVQQVEPIVYTPADGQAVPIPILRLMTDARVVPDPATPDRSRELLTTNAVLDTGSYLTIIHRAEWERYERYGLIEWSDPAPHDLTTTAVRTFALSQRSFQFHLGRVRVEVLDVPERTTMPPVSVTAQFVLDPTPPRTVPVVFGLHLGILDGRRLTRTPVPPVDAAPRTDAGPRFGQQWFLEVG